MKSLFIQPDNAEIVQRINRLAADSKREWGKMNVGQMLAHAQAPLRVSLGEMKLKRSLIGLLVGPFAKKKLSAEGPWEKDMPTDKHFVIGEQRDFEEEKKKLVTLVQRFAQSGAGGIVNDTHPFFGTLTTNEWDRLMWNHLDH